VGTAETEHEKPKSYLLCRWNRETVAGVRLDNNTGETKQSERRFLDSKVTVAGVELNNNTALTTLEKPSNFRKHYENEE
jgi:hypothetical protein